MGNTASKSKSNRTGRSKAAAHLGQSSKSQDAPAKSISAQTANKDGGKRLSPGALDGLVVGYMKRNRSKLPVTAGVVGRGIKRSPGAIANCLERLEKAGKVKLTNKMPRKYDLVSSRK